jgi:hypothetical protein
MDNLSSYFEDLLGKINKTKADINIMIKKIEDDGGSEKKDDKRIISSSSIEPMTRLRKNVNEVKNAQENPYEQFIIDRVNDVFK